VNRVEKYRRIREMKRRYILAVMLLFFILITGLSAVDSSNNYLMSGKRGIELVKIESQPEYIRVSFMNRNIYINTKYINRDLRKLKKILGIEEE